MTVQLNIKSAEVRDLAMRVAQRTGETMTEAIAKALAERLRLLEKDERLEAIMRMVSGNRERWDPETVDVDHGDLLYDERGLPK